MDPNRPDLQRSGQQPERKAQIQRVTPTTGPEDPPSRSAAGTGGPGGSVVQKPPATGGNLSKLLVVAVLILAAWFFFGRGGAYAGPEEQAPEYKQHQQANRGTLKLTSRDINRDATRAAVAAAMSGQAIPGMAHASPQMVAAIKNNQVDFYNIHIYDTCAEDGDVVTLRSDAGGVLGPAALTHGGTTFTIPVVQGQPPQVTIMANKDGDGGITIGAKTSGGVWYSSVIPEGGSETIPLAVQ